jgi:hypothetical protein
VRPHGARDDSRNDPWIRKFADDLKEALRVLLGLQHEPLFYDSETITAGSRWREVLADALRQSRVCVALCSTSYVSSAFAGEGVPAAGPPPAATPPPFSES